MYSVRQIKFECLAYIKEFDADPSPWHTRVYSHPGEMLVAHGVDDARDVWMYKPAASPTAARTVLRFPVDRMGVRAAGQDDTGGYCPLLFRKACRPAWRRGERPG